MPDKYLEVIGACILSLFMIYALQNFLKAFIFGFIVFFIFYINFKIDFETFDFMLSSIFKFIEVTFIDFVPGYIISIALYFTTKKLFRKIEDGTVL